MEREEITYESISQEKSLNLEILKASKHEEEIWRIKSCQLWLKGEDKNTNYFHKKTKNRMSFNFIKELKDNNNQKIIG